MNSVLAENGAGRGNGHVHGVGRGRAPGRLHPTKTVPSGWRTTTVRSNRNSAIAGSPDPTKRRFRIVVQAQPAGGRQRTPNASYLVSGKDMTSQMKYIHRRGGRIVSITEVM